MGLLALGVVVIVGVIGFNKWQERKYRKAARGFVSGHEDVLLNARGAASHAEPPHVESSYVEPSQAVPDPVAARVEPHWDGATEAAPEVASPVRGRSAPRPGGVPDAMAELDSRIDVIAELEFDTPRGAQAVAELVAAAGLARMAGCDGFNRESQTWEALVGDTQYGKARVGLQLTDRSGPIREPDLSAFQRSIEALAADCGARVAWTGSQNPLTNAAELDAFCAEVDVQIGISLVAATTFAETKFRGLAEANGFKRDDDAVFRRRDDNGLELLTLRQSAPAAVSLLLDVPRVPRDAAAFGLMAHCARTLAKGLEAKIVDDNQRVLDDAMLTRIGQEIAGVQGRMEAAGLPSGGPLALRLFA